MLTHRFLVALETKITDFIITHNLIPDGSSIIVGLSGGPDSVFLLHYLVQLKNDGRVSNLIAAHLNHEWRKESDQEQEWCKALCAKLRVPFVSKRLSDYKDQIKFNGSKEAYARGVRRKFFNEILTEYNADAIALGHHLQDQQETFLIRLVRGTSLSGLTCMWPKRGHYIRPLLQTSKHDIIAYLKKHAIDYLIDPTNVSHDFLRNRIRATVIPALQECDSRFDHNFSSTLERLQNTEQFLEKLTHKTFDQINTDKGLNLDLLFEQPKPMQYRLLMHWLITHKLPFPPTQSFLDEVVRFLKQPGNKTHTIHENLHIKKEKGYAHII